MLIKGSDVIGLEVITLQRGKKINNIKDIIYDPKEQKVKALLIDTGGWFSALKVISFDDIQNIGRDAVMVESSSALKNAAEAGERITRIVEDNMYLTKEKVITSDGINLGKISDLYFDSKSGKVEEFEVESDTINDFQGYIKRIRAADVITVGEDVIIVNSHSKEKPVRKKLKDVFNMLEHSAGNLSNVPPV